MRHLWCLLFLLVSCSEADFEKFSELGSLRVVAIVADTPEVDADSGSAVNVTLTPYISDISAAGRTFSVLVTGCVDPGFSQSGSPSCSDQTFTYPNSNSFDTTTLAGSNYTGAMDSVTISIPTPSTLTQDYSTRERFNGVNYLVYFTLSSGGETLLAIKSIAMTTRTSLNQNPGIEDVLFEGSSIANTPTTRGELSYTTTATGGAENYLEMAVDGSTSSQEERYLFSWFAAEGASVSPGRIVEGQTTTFRPQEGFSTPTLIGVLRDGRGGSDVRILQP